MLSGHPGNQWKRAASIPHFHVHSLNGRLVPVDSFVYVLDAQLAHLLFLPSKENLSRDNVTSMSLPEFTVPRKIILNIYIKVLPII